MGCSSPRLPSFGWWAALLALLATWALSNEPRTRWLAFNSLRLAVATAAVSLPIGTLLAVLLCRCRVSGKAGLVGWLAGWMLVPVYVQTAAWQSACGWVTGLALSGWAGAIWVHGLAAVPWVTAIVSLGLCSAAPELEEVALLDGTDRQVLFRVTLRRAAGWAILAALWVGVSATGEIGATDLMQVRTFAEEVLDPFKYHQPRPELWSSAGICGLVTLAAAAVAWRLTPPLASMGLARPRAARLQRLPIPATPTVWGIVLLLTLTPIAVLAYQTGLTTVPTVDGYERGWSLRQAMRLALGTVGRHQRELGWSLSIAGASATAAVAAAITASWWARAGGWRAWTVGLLGALCLAVPGPVLGVLLIQLFNRPQWPLLLTLYDRTILAPWSAQTLRALPLCLLALGPLLAGEGGALHDAARCDGATAVARFWELGLRQHVRPLIGCWWLGFAWSLGELSASILVLPPGMDTLPRRTFGLIHSGVQDHVAALCLLQIAAMAVPVALMFGLAARLPGRGPTSS